MALENREISDLIKKCKNLLLDIEGTTTSISFVKDKLFPYAEENVKSFLESHWETEDVKEAVTALRKQAAEDQEKSIDGLVEIPGEDASKDEQVEGLVNNVKWQMSADQKVGPLKQLQGLIWKEGYDKGDIKGHVYDDVPPALELWRSTEGQKVYIYSSGSVQAQKLLFHKSLAGDMLPLIDGHFDTAVGTKMEAASYAAIAEKIGCNTEEILFLTDIVKEAEAARASGLQAALVSREGNAPLPAEATASFPVLHSLEQLALTNKRKPDPQVEEVPAKVSKTDVQDDVKAASEIEAQTDEANRRTESREAMQTAVVVEKTEEPVTMEVEETSDALVMENKVESAVEMNTATDELVAITEKDVPMEDASVNVSTVTENNAAVETIVGKADNTEITVTAYIADSSSTAEPVADMDITMNVSSTEAMVEAPKDLESTVEEAKVEEATVEAPKALESKLKEAGAKVELVTVEAPIAVESKVEEAMAKVERTAVEGPKALESKVKEEVAKVESKAQMVDAATLTENIDPAVKKLAVEIKKVDAATETTLEPNVHMSKTEKTSVEDMKVESPIDEPITIETPAVEVTAVEAIVEQTSVEAPVNDTMDALIEPKEPSTDHAEESDKVEAHVAKTENATTTNSKAEDLIKMKPVDDTVLDNSKATTKDANGTDNRDTKAITSDNSTNLKSSATDVPIESVKDVDVQAMNQSEEMSVVVDDQKNIVDAPTIKIDLVIEDIGEKTESNKTENLETEVKVNKEKVETVTEPNELIEDLQVEADINETSSSVEIKDITDDKESLGEVTDTNDDVVPIVEEPSSNLEEMEELQNAGDVLEKECDEILSKVQDVTNLDYMPAKPLHTIAEEMETDNMDTNDIVEGILDTEMELSMKPEDIDLNTLQEITEPKSDSDEKIGKDEPGNEKPNETPKVDDVTEKMEVSCDSEMVTEKPNENKFNSDAKEATLKPTEEKMETEEVVEPEIKSENKVSTSASAEESLKPREWKKNTDLPIVVEPATDDSEQISENKESDKTSVAVVQEEEKYVPQDTKIDDAAEPKVNGKTNGDANVKLNGDSKQDEDLKSRLRGENSKEKVNGSNGDSADAEIGQGDNKVEAESSDIKLKTVATDEAPAPIEQPVET